MWELLCGTGRLRVAQQGHSAAAGSSQGLLRPCPRIHSNPHTTTSPSQQPYAAWQQEAEAGGRGAARHLQSLHLRGGRRLPALQQRRAVAAACRGGRGEACTGERAPHRPARPLPSPSKLGLVQDAHRHAPPPPLPPLALSPRLALALARLAQERVASFVVKEYGNAAAVPTAVLMEVLRQEVQVHRVPGRLGVRLPPPDTSAGWFHLGLSSVCAAAHSAQHGIARLPAARCRPPPLPVF